MELTTYYRGMVFPLEEKFDQNVYEKQHKFSGKAFKIFYKNYVYIELDFQHALQIINGACPMNSMLLTLNKKKRKNFTINYCSRKKYIMN